MKINKTSHKKTILAIAAALLVIGSVVSVYVYTQNTGKEDNRNNTSSHETKEETNYEPATKEEQAGGQQTADKEGKANEPATPTTSDTLGVRTSLL